MTPELIYRDLYVLERQRYDVLVGQWASDDIRYETDPEGII